ncbi:MAG: hypothetical protein ACLR5S_09995 [Ruminococcus sp.]
MDLKINREMLPVTEVILDEMQEQSVELDYVLPDYDPDIFRMIGCEISPPSSHPPQALTASPMNCVPTSGCCTAVPAVPCSSA